MTVATCSGITRHGERCRARPITGKPWCINHDPAISDEERKAWNAKGGRHSSKVERVKRQLPDIETMTTEEVRALLGLVFRQVIAGKIDPPVANAAANVARALGDLSKVQVDEFITELDEMIDQVEGRRAS